MSTEYADRVHAWAGELRSGSTRTWAEFLDGERPSAAPAVGDDSGPLPSAAQLELVRRLVSAGDAVDGLPDFAGLADLVTATGGPGRGLVDVPLPWPGPAAGSASGARIGTPPVAPDELPADELLRVCAGVLVKLLAAEADVPLDAPARPWRPWRRGFTLLGAPTTVDVVRSALLAKGLREGGARTTYVVLGGPLDELMAQRWSARVRAGAATRWQRMWRVAAARDRVPPGIALPTIAAHLAQDFDAARVHVVLGTDATSTAALVGEILGVPLGPVAHRYDVLATDLLRRVNPALVLAVGEEARRRVVGRVWADIAGGETSGPLGIPASHLDWAVGAGERMATALSAGRYAVHGDPALVVPTRRAGVRRAPDPDDVLAHALRVVGRAWRRRVAGTETAGGRG